MTNDPTVHTDHPLAAHGSLESLADGGTHLLDVVAAVDYLARGLRHDFTVWDALEEALRWWSTETHHLRHNGPAPTSAEHPWLPDRDPLQAALRRFVYLLDDPETSPAATALQQAVRRWTATMADHHNASHTWPHPVPRRGFPPPRFPDVPYGG